MRLELRFTLEKDTVQKDYRRKILSFLKKSLEDYNLEIKKYFFDTPESRDYTFSVYFDIKNIENDFIRIGKKGFELYFSIENTIEGIHFYNAFLNSKRKKFYFDDENSFELIGIRKLQEREILKESAIFKTNSPIVIRERIGDNKDWYHLMDIRGIEVLKKNIVHNLKNRFSREKLEEIEIIPIDMRKNVVDYYGIKIQCSRGTFAVKGDRAILNYFYKTGIGSKRKSGFSYLELIN